jgi:hypothetical protein
MWGKFNTGKKFNEKNQLDGIFGSNPALRAVRSCVLQLGMNLIWKTGLGPFPPIT